MHSHKFAIFATVESFGSFDILVPSKLPSKKAALQIFLEKVQTLNSNYHCSLNVIFIVNPLHEKQFDTEIDRYMKGRDLESSRDTETSMFDFKFQKLLYVFLILSRNRFFLAWIRIVRLSWKTRELSLSIVAEILSGI